jgi:hypothetical protein
VRENVNNSNLVTLVGRLNTAMIRLGSGIRYEIEMGNKTLGRNWILVEKIPGRSPVRQHLGQSPRSADWFIEGMLRALQAVTFDRDLLRDAQSHVSKALAHDPDARSVRRGAEEESFPIHKLPVANLLRANKSQETR